MRTLKIGCRGEDVRNLQYRSAITADGSFGPNTEKTVKTEQIRLGLEPDGSVGPMTQRAFWLSDFRVDIYSKEKWDIWFAGTPYKALYKPLRKLKDWAKIENADIVYNLAWFNMGGGLSFDKYGIIRGRTLTYLRGKGVEIGYGGTSDRITIDNGNICGGVKVGIRNGSIQHGLTNTITAINANGLLKDGSYFHVQSVMLSTEKALVAYVNANYDVAVLFIQDGGGSSGKYDAERNVLLAGKKEGAYGRSVASVFCARRK